MFEHLTIPPKLHQAIEKNNLVLFIGAGCSLSLGFPTWKVLIENILDELDNKFGPTSSTNFKNISREINNGSSLFYALDEIEKNSKHGGTYKTKTKEYISIQMDMLSQSLPEESKIHTELWNLSKKIITTNYDKVLEKYKPHDVSLKIFDNDNAFQGLKSNSKDAQFLYKIHGDYENPKTMILFESDYRDIYKNDNYNNDVLATNFKDKTLLFIGFSLTDPFINDLFSKVKSIYQGYTINEHFIFTTKSEDFTEYDVTPIHIENWNESLLKYLSHLQNFIPKNSESNNYPILILESKGEELTENDVNNIVQLINKKTDELLANPSDKELNKEIRDLRIKLNKLLFDKIDYLQEVDKSYKNNDLQILFDTIYSSEKLDSQTLENINNVRNNTEIYKWHHRSVIVSAITCSLIHFNKADEKKIALLIDFINDNEEKVWQKAVTSLFMVLNHLGNKWLRFPAIKTKIQSLNQNLRIQDACSYIIQLFVIGLNNVSMVDEDLFKNPYFSDNPFNYFLPYYQDENAEFDKIYETYEGHDIESFIGFLNNVPIPDQMKYLLCGDNSKNEDFENKEEIIASFNYILHLNSIFYPYSVYVQELINFYRYFPVYKHEEKLKSQLKLTDTPLKDYLLNEKQKFSALGSHFMQENNWSQAIINYKETIKIDGNSIKDLLNLAKCYNKNKEKNNEFDIRKKVLEIDPNNEFNLYGLFSIYYYDKKDFNKSLSIAKQLIEIDSKNANYHNCVGIAYEDLNEKQLSITYFSEAIRLNPKSYIFLSNRARVYASLNQYEESLIDWNNAIEMNPKNDTLYSNRADFFYDRKEYKKSNSDLEKAISLNKKNSFHYLNRALNSLYVSAFEEALYYIQKGEKLDKDIPEVYNSYANYYRLTKDYEKAFDYIERAEKLGTDKRYVGTKATIYASIGDDDNFFKYLEEAFLAGADARLLFHDIQNKYEKNTRFKALLKKYNQKLD